MSLSNIILSKIKRDHCGKERAITRRELLDYCRVYDSALTDRELRNIYSRLPVISSNNGIFWPIRESELDEFEQYCRKKALPLFIRFKMVAKEHKKLLSEKFVQWNLF